MSVFPHEKKWTVVGIHQTDPLDPDDGVYVEWVMAEDQYEAAHRAKNLHPDRATTEVLAVFAGHRIDHLYNRGLASG